MGSKQTRDMTTTHDRPEFNEDPEWGVIAPHRVEVATQIACAMIEAGHMPAIGAQGIGDGTIHLTNMIFEKYDS